MSVLDVALTAAAVPSAVAAAVPASHYVRERQSRRRRARSLQNIARLESEMGLGNSYHGTMQTWFPSICGDSDVELLRLSPDDYPLSGMLRDGRGWLGFWGSGHAS